MFSINNFLIICMFATLFADTSALKMNLSRDEITSIARADNHTHFTTVLEQLIQPRVVGSFSHEKVKNYIINELKASNFDVELDSFEEHVPIFGNVTFTNIIGRLNPNASTFLTLACHYDSKYFPFETFHAATDSAVPCSIMLNVARTLQTTLDQRKTVNNYSLMLIFFDGEEAIVEWTPTDSLYGSRHLATKWDKDGTLDSIDVMVLLDLIGAPNPKFRSFYRHTDSLHAQLFDIEKYLHDHKIINNQIHMFEPTAAFGGVDDDHRPFLEKGVPILHVIPYPFPKVWHKLSDNLENLSMSTIRNFIKILRLFVVDYFVTPYISETRISNITDSSLKR